jgi:hypothetical protein
MRRGMSQSLHKDSTSKGSCSISSPSQEISWCRLCQSKPVTVSSSSLATQKKASDGWNGFAIGVVGDSGSTMQCEDVLNILPCPWKWCIANLRILYVSLKFKLSMPTPVDWDISWFHMAFLRCCNPLSTVRSYRTRNHSHQTVEAKGLGREVLLKRGPHASVVCDFRGSLSTPAGPRKLADYTSS